MHCKIVNNPVATATCQLEPGECLMANPECVTKVSTSIKAGSTGGLSNIFKRAMTGERTGLSPYKANNPGEVVIAAAEGERIKQFDLNGGLPTVFQKRALIAYDQKLKCTTAIRRTVTGYGFENDEMVMDELYGRGFALVKSEGSLIEHKVGHNEVISVPAGSVIAFKGKLVVETYRMDNPSGEGITYRTNFTGPGSVWLPNDTPIENLSEFIDFEDDGKKKKKRKK